MKNVPLLLISGWAHGEEALRPVAEAMAGCGQIGLLSLASSSFGDEAEEGFSSYARTISSHLDKLGEPACIVGWSTGGVAALETSARYPEKVACLVLLSATARFRTAEGYTSGVRPAVLRAMLRGLRKNPETVVSEFISRALHPLNFHEEALAERTRAALAAGTDSLARGLEYLADADLRRELVSIALPCLIIHGRQDMIVPWQAGQYLQDNLSNSEAEFIPAAGHCLAEQCAEGLARRIAQFVERL